MITNNDLVKMAAFFATKEDLRKQKDQIKDMLTDFRSDILDGQDKIYKELKDFREEQGSHSLRHEDTESQLRAIKAIPAIAHALKK